MRAITKNINALTSDAGALLLREVERATGILRQFTAWFTDHRDAARIEHPVASLVAQRVYGLALGYEDLNDHDLLRADPLLAALAGAAPSLPTARAAPPTVSPDALRLFE